MSLGFSFYYCFAILFIKVFVALGQDEEELFTEKECQEYLFGYLSSTMNATMRCIRGQGTFKMSNPVDLITYRGCLVKCIIQQQGSIGEDGKIDKISAAIYFLKTFPKEAHDAILSEIVECAPFADELNPDEENCKTYLPFAQCSIKAILKGLMPYGKDCLTIKSAALLDSLKKYVDPKNLLSKLDELTIGKAKSIWNSINS